MKASPLRVSKTRARTTTQETWIVSRLSPRGNHPSQHPSEKRTGGSASRRASQVMTRPMPERMACVRYFVGLTKSRHTWLAFADRSRPQNRFLTVPMTPIAVSAQRDHADARTDLAALIEQSWCPALHRRPSRRPVRHLRCAARASRSRISRDERQHPPRESVAKGVRPHTNRTTSRRYFRDDSGSGWLGAHSRPRRQ